MFVMMMVMIVDSHRRYVWYRIDLETTKCSVGCRRHQQWNDTDLKHNDTKEVSDGGCWFHDPLNCCEVFFLDVWCSSLMCDVLDADPDVYQGFGVRYLFLVTSATFGVIENKNWKDRNNNTSTGTWYKFRSTQPYIDNDNVPVTIPEEDQDVTQRARQEIHYRYHKSVVTTLTCFVWLLNCISLFEVFITSSHIGIKGPIALLRK